MYQDARDDDSEEVASDERIIEALEKGPMLGTFQCFEGFDKYKGKGIYAGPSHLRFPYYAYKVPKKDPTFIQYHSEVITGYLKDPDHGLVFEYVTTNEDFGKQRTGYIARHLFISVDSIRGVEKVVI